MFAVILPGRPCVTDLQTISGPPTPQFALSFPSHPKFNHIVVFMLPGNTLPPDAAAAVYIQFPGNNPEFKLLGAIGNEKQSAIFKVNFPDTPGGTSGVSGGIPEGSSINLGISIEPKSSIQSQLENNKTNPSSSSGALVSTKPQVSPQPSTKVLAQRIIQNAFNFLSSFSGTMANGQEVVPLKSFQDWWVRFERKVENDPGFLERPQD